MSGTNDFISNVILLPDSISGLYNVVFRSTSSDEIENIAKICGDGTTISQIEGVTDCHAFLDKEPLLTVLSNYPQAKAVILFPMDNKGFAISCAYSPMGCTGISDLVCVDYCDPEDSWYDEINPLENKKISYISYSTGEPESFRYVCPFQKEMAAIGYEPERPKENVTEPATNKSSAEQKNQKVEIIDGFSIEKGVLTGYSGDSTVLVIPQKAKKIGNSAFRNCQNLQEVTIPDGVTVIGEGAFADCTALCVINIPDSVKKIGCGAFGRCTALQKIVIPEAVEKIESDMFCKCTALKEVRLPENLKAIDSWAFAECTSIEMIRIPDSVEKIGEQAFRGCKRLEKITLPSKLKKVQYYTFGHCDSLTSVVIQSGTSEIGELAFGYCQSLSSIVFPEGLMNIGNEAFRECTALTSISFPNGLIGIGTEVFAGCTALSTVIFPDGLEKIGRYAFIGCKDLISVFIPASVKTIGEYVGKGLWSTMHVFSDCKNLTIYAPKKSVAHAFAEANRIPFVPKQKSI